MNYIELINQFWQTRRSVRISSTEADLYFCLLQESNSRGWKNPFECSNGLICALITIDEKTLLRVRNGLQQKGLINFTAGQRNKKPPLYEICYTQNACNYGGNLGGNYGGNYGGNLGGKENKLNKTKPTPPLPPKGGVPPSPDEEQLQTADLADDADDSTDPPQRFSPPTVAEVADYIAAKGYVVDPRRFCAHYQSNGWRVGKNKMKNWRAAVTNWHYRDEKERKQLSQINKPNESITIGI